MATVIVPAHNEGSVIRRCLDSLVDQDEVDQVIVACNGCSDDTVSIVTSEFPQFTCLDIDRPSKVNAINEAEKHVDSWPVVYMDADLVLSPGAIGIVLSGMKAQGLLLASPEPITDLTKSSFLVRRFYDAWLSMPYLKEGVMASGTYVISREGRRRFAEFPDVIADDGFVRSHFYNDELGNIQGATVSVCAPRTLSALIKVKTRARLGNMELAARRLGYDKPAPDYGSAFSSLLLSRKWLSGLIYILIVIVVRLRAQKQFKDLENYEWEVDHSSR
jgi:glycosyltransferase involved in cell wall biosynthesis